MADIIGAIFGTSSKQGQTTTPDPVAQALNTLRLQQAMQLFGGVNSVDFIRGGPDDVYRPTQETQRLADAALSSYRPVDYSNLISLDNYRQSFTPVLSNYERAKQDLDRQTTTGINQNYADFASLDAMREADLARAKAGSYYDYNLGTRNAYDAYNFLYNDLNNQYNQAIARGDFDLARSIQANEAYANRALSGNQSNYLRSLGIADTDAARSLVAQELARGRALDLGLRSTDNYISQIATPRINQAMALQGLERGGAVPSAIARATAETAMPFLQGIETAFGSNVANTLNSLMGLKGNIGTQRSALDAAVNQALMGEQATALQSASEGNRALASQRMSAQTTAGTNYSNQLTQLAQALMANNISLEQVGINAQSALGQQLMQAQTALRTQQQQGTVSLANTYNPLYANFVQSLPGAAELISLTPSKMQLANAGVATALTPFADINRQLKESDFLRRQGLFTTLYTGIPFSPGSTTVGKSSTGNIFDQLGGTISSGVTGGEGGFSTLGTKT